MARKTLASLRFAELYTTPWAIMARINLGFAVLRRALYHALGHHGFGGCVPYFTQFSWMFSMIHSNLASTSSALQLRRSLFCDISRPLTLTPPALLALPGE